MKKKQEWKYAGWNSNTTDFETNIGDIQYKAEEVNRGRILKHIKDNIENINFEITGEKGDSVSFFNDIIVNSVIDLDRLETESGIYIYKNSKSTANKKKN